jgi:hypothetical protein
MLEREIQPCPKGATTFAMLKKLHFMGLLFARYLL